MHLENNKDDRDALRHCDSRSDAHDGDILHWVKSKLPFMFPLQSFRFTRSKKNYISIKYLIALRQFHQVSPTSFPSFFCFFDFEVYEELLVFFLLSWAVIAAGLRFYSNFSYCIPNTNLVALFYENITWIDMISRVYTRTKKKINQVSFPRNFFVFPSWDADQFSFTLYGEINHSFFGRGTYLFISGV